MATRQFVTLFIVISVLAYCQAAATKSSSKSSNKKLDLKHKHEFVEDATDVVLPDLNEDDFYIEYLYYDENGNEVYVDGWEYCDHCDYEIYDYEDYYDNYDWLRGPENAGDYVLKGPLELEVDGDDYEEEEDDYDEEDYDEEGENEDEEGEGSAEYPEEQDKQEETIEAAVSHEDLNKSVVETTTDRP